MNVKTGSKFVNVKFVGDTVNSTVYETHLRDNHTKEQMATQIAMRMINSMEGR